MADRDNDEFYVGYRPQAPARTAQYVRRRVVALMLVAALLAVVLVAAQDRFAQAWFEFGNHRSFDGYVSEFPYPTLLVERPHAEDSAVPFSRYLLSVPGKYGAQEALAGLDGKRVRLSGTLIYRDDQTMVEVLPDSVQTLEGLRADAPAAETASLGSFRLSGEIVDSKCYLGVMKPGNFKAHRACAIRCISGGIPAVFVARDHEGASMHLLLVGSDDRILNDEILDFVADPIELDGEILRDGGLLVLRTEPSSFRRLY